MFEIAIFVIFPLIVFFHILSIHQKDRKELKLFLNDEKYREGLNAKNFLNDIYHRILVFRILSCLLILFILLGILIIMKDIS